MSSAEEGAHNLREEEGAHNLREEERAHKHIYVLLLLLVSLCRVNSRRLYNYIRTPSVWACTQNRHLIRSKKITKNSESHCQDLNL